MYVQETSSNYATPTEEMRTHMKVRHRTADEHGAVVEVFSPVKVRGGDGGRGRGRGRE